MISYAQNFEDVVLHRVFQGKKGGFYIDVGAMDPVLESVTKFFYDEGWSGINIEPNEWFYNKLLQERPRDINLNLAVGEREEIRPLYVFEQHGISTFEESGRDRFVARGYELKEEMARVTTLAAVCRDYVRRPIDFLKVDCEGWEQFVLRGADWDRFRPIVLVVEATAPGTKTPSWSEWEPFLIENARYDMVYFDGLNRFYVRREYSDLRCRFGPPSVFDGFKPHATEAAEQAKRALERERDCVLGRVAELEETLNRTTAENQQFTESLHKKEAELRCVRMSLEAAEQARKVLTEERDSLAARVVELEAQALCNQQQLAGLQKEHLELETHISQLDETLLKTRLWVGRLSQDLAASRRRP